MPAIHFEKDHKSFNVLPGTNLRKAALQGGIHLYGAFHRVFHLNLDLGPLRFPCGSDIVEVEGKGMNARTEEEEAVIAGRWLFKRKVAPSHRLACMLQVNGDITVKTLPYLEIDKGATKARAGFLGVILGFLLLMGGIMLLIGLDLVKKL
ncbi:MAG: hypothetical protein WBD36_13835 [Bacteroidota bacterium]